MPKKTQHTVRESKERGAMLPVDAKAEAAAAALLTPADCSEIGIDPDLCCPITSQLMSDPVVTADGQP